jgi:hypothetical protein
VSNLENQFQSTLQKTRLRVRCPHCYKLYSVATEEIREAKPKFECVDCHGRFWIAFPESLEHAGGVIGFAIEATAPAATNSLTATTSPAATTAPIIAKPFSCPKCGEAYAGGDRECTRCGVIFAKFSAARENTAHTEISASPELRDLWEAALNDYDNQSRHQQFLGYAQIEGNLEYALSKYNLILENCPADQMAARAQAEAKALMVARLEARMPVMHGKESKGIFSGLQDAFANIPLRIPGFRFGTLIMFLCAMVIVTGLIVPGQRNLAGVGSSILFFILALRYYFRAI